MPWNTSPKPTLRSARYASALADVKPVGIRIDEAEAAVVRVHRARNQAFAAAALHLEPRISAHAQRDVCAVEAALGVAFLVAVRREADLDVVVDPRVRLAAGRERVELREPGVYS